MPHLKKKKKKTHSRMPTYVHWLSCKIPSRQILFFFIFLSYYAWHLRTRKRLTNTNALVQTHSRPHTTVYWYVYVCTLKRCLTVVYRNLRLTDHNDFTYECCCCFVDDDGVCGVGVKCFQEFGCHHQHRNVTEIEDIKSERQQWWWRRWWRHETFLWASLIYPHYWIPEKSVAFPRLWTGWRALSIILGKLGINNHQGRKEEGREGREGKEGKVEVKERRKKKEWRKVVRKERKESEGRKENEGKS